MTASFSALSSAIEAEVPEAWQESWDDADGANLPLSVGATAAVKFKVNGGTQVSRSAALNTTTSTTTVTWQASDYTTAGLMAGEVIITDGSNVYKRSFARVILPARGGV